MKLNKPETAAWRARARQPGGEESEDGVLLELV